MYAIRRPQIVRWSVSAGDDPDALDRYREGLADWYGASEFDEAALPLFFTEKLICRFGDLVIWRGRSIEQTLVRGVHEIKRSGMDGVTLSLDLGGMEGDIDGVRVSGRPGTVHIRHLARPSAARAKALDVISIVVPREAAPDWLLERRMHGAIITNETAIGKVLTNHMLALAATAPTMEIDEGAASIRATLTLAEKAFLNSGRLPNDQTAAVYAGIRASATILIDRHLTDPQLGIDRLASAIGVSRATLFRAFAQGGGISSYIRRQRLHRARTVLLGRIGRNPSVAEIAHAHGFTSEAHFSRLFKSAYGESPGSVPSNPTHRAGPKSMNIRYDLLLDWMKGSPN